MGFSQNLALIDYQLDDLYAARMALENHLEAARQVNSRQFTPLILGSLLLVYADLSLPEQTLALINELLGWFNQTTVLVVDDLLFCMASCLWFSLNPVYANLDQVDDCLRHLERGYRQLRSPLAEAYLLEGRAYAAVLHSQPAAAVEDLQRAVSLWEQISHHYERMRALSALHGALNMTGDVSGAQAACQQARNLLHDLADQIDDPHLKHTFFNSSLARQNLGCSHP